MKTFFTLLRIDARWIWSALFFSVYICTQNIIMSRTDQMFSLNMNSNGSDIFLLIIPSMSMGFFFAGTNSRMRNLPYSSASPVDIREFLFSRAINRGQIFYSKSSIYAGLVLVPIMTIWIYSLFNPLVRIELPYNTPSAREITKDFYLHHFEGAYVQKDEKDKEGNKAYVVLPKGRTTIAEFTVIWALAATLLLEMMIFVAPPGRWSIPTLSVLLLLLLMSYIGWPSANTPSRYEACLAWVSQHTLLAFLALALFAALSQIYCCRRFVRMESIS